VTWRTCAVLIFAPNQRPHTQDNCQRSSSFISNRHHTHSTLYINTPQKKGKTSRTHCWMDQNSSNIERVSQQRPPLSVNHHACEECLCFTETTMHLTLNHYAYLKTCRTLLNHGFDAISVQISKISFVLPVSIAIHRFGVRRMKHMRTQTEHSDTR